MAKEGRTDLTSDKWAPWIEGLCERVGVDPDLVDVPLLHDMTREVAHRYDRPMAPISSYIIGVALGKALAQDEGVDAAALLHDYVAHVEATLPPEQ